MLSKREMNAVLAHVAATNQRVRHLLLGAFPSNIRETRMVVDVLDSRYDVLKEQLYYLTLPECELPLEQKSPKARAKAIQKREEAHEKLRVRLERQARRNEAALRKMYPACEDMLAALKKWGDE